MTRDELLATLRKNHDDLLASLNKYTDEEKETVQLQNGWTPKDLLAHVTRWENVCAGYLEKVLAGDPIPLLEQTTDELNARAYEEDRALPLSEVWRNSDASFVRVMAMAESLTEEQANQPMRGPWRGSGDEFLPLYQIIGIDTFEHYQVHQADVGGRTEEVVSGDVPLT